MRRTWLVPIAVALAACGSPLPESDPEAVGTADAVAAQDGDVAISFVPDVGYEYFEGTTFVVGDEVPVGGSAKAASDIEAGDAIAVWTDVCAESFPVQCVVTAVEVLD
ncbi:hypothetical protein [Demequina flava]|uniref:hypothetical protein n=1 Tax=Demequina flava TaxID=1095025 RepID=UPI0007849A57|nr:hypothetical protein [Demequina flava]